MKILFLSMPSIHAVRWIENLKEAGNDLYWFDVLGKGNLPTTIPIQQITDWKKRKLQYIKGEHFLSKNRPRLYDKIKPFLEVTANQKFEQLLQEIKPDVVHSFEMQSCSYPILDTMQKYPKIKWMYSCWGSDLFYYQHQAKHQARIKMVLKRINYLHTDCERDFTIAKELGFKGKHVGIIPGGGGYDLSQYKTLSVPFAQREIILVKGYHHLFGRALNVIKALELLKEEIKQYKIVVFGAHKVVNDYVVNRNLAFKVYDRDALQNEEVLKLMGQSLIYIGNNISDGTANTLLEAIVMGAFPIQSNPGNVSAEIIEHGVNGFLIKDPENIDYIASLMIQAIENKEMLVQAQKHNKKIALEKLEYSLNQQKVIALYRNIEMNF